ncbi:hypothetical protein JZ751_015172 [Albula glossodonta]|uniref:Uncharacterized protein n=1 Tax=Albula glossodonta TaxID=121402 RepID=A0A8T2NTV8_9TELE|nr:hypothetical protein JZ751_015172 [Albula glossodonta]
MSLLKKKTTLIFSMTHIAAKANWSAKVRLSFFHQTLLDAKREREGKTHRERDRQRRKENSQTFKLPSH